MIISEAFASTGGQQVGLGGSLMPFLLVLVIFYILLIRPQQKKIKEHDELVANLKTGDKVMTGGGIIGKVSSLNKEKGVVFVKIASGVEVEVASHTIHALVKEDGKSGKNKEKMIKEGKKGKK
jgi:preprotein translocase subunit YajC